MPATDFDAQPFEDHRVNERAHRQSIVKEGR